MNDFNEQHKAVIDEMVQAMPGVKIGKAFGYPAYKVNGKMFAFIGGPGIAVKLPEARVKALIESNDAMHPFQPTEGTTWREWVSIDRDNSADYAQDAALLEESMRYVLSKTS